MYVPVGFTRGEETLLLSRTDTLVKLQEAEDRKRTLVVILGATGALLAPARLGIVAIPFIKARRK
jgi:hypothetical protein